MLAVNVVATMTLDTIVGWVIQFRLIGEYLKKLLKLEQRVLLKKFYKFDISINYDKSAYDNVYMCEACL